MSKTAQQYFHRTGITHVTTTAYWPQANGLVERMVGITKAVLRKMLQQCSTDEWTEKVQHATFAINCSKQGSMGKSPFLLMHGYEPRLCSEASFGTVIDDLGEAERLRLLALEREAAHDALENSQIASKQRHDNSQRTPHLKEGDWVWKRVKKSSPWAPEFDGPFEVVDFVTDNTVRICRSSDGKTKEANIGQLKLFKRRSSEDPI